MVEAFPGPSGTERTPRVVAARKLLRRAGRDRAGRFLVEGAQAVREAVRYARVRELFVTAAAAGRHPELVADAERAGARISPVTDRAAAVLSETVTPQGLVAVCDLLDVPVAAALSGASRSERTTPSGASRSERTTPSGASRSERTTPSGAPRSDQTTPSGRPRLVAVCVGVADPGNAGTVIRVADAAGADAVLFAGDTVDPHNGKAVRASTGSVFHVPLARDRDAAAVLDACRAAGLTVLVADAAGEVDLCDPGADPVLAGPVAWIFGGETHGVPATLVARADHRVRVPILGRAESLNLGTAAAVCLYASVAADRRQPEP